MTTIRKCDIVKLSSLSALNAQQVCDHLLETLITYQGGSNQDDDVTLVSIRA